MPDPSPPTPRRLVVEITTTDPGHAARGLLVLGLARSLFAAAEVVDSGWNPTLPCPCCGKPAMLVEAPPGTVACDACGDFEVAS